MAAQPRDTDIEMMVSLTNVSRSEAIARLKVWSLFQIIGASAYIPLRATTTMSVRL
jgi:hypothetical protein